MELNIQNGTGLVISTKYANFTKEYNEMIYQCTNFIKNELEKITLAPTDEDKLLAAIEFKSKVFPPEQHLTDTKALIASFILKFGNPIGVKEIDLVRLFYLCELLKMMGTVARDKTPIEIINYIFCNKDFDMQPNSFTFKKMTNEVFDVLNEYEDIYLRFKDVTENVKNNNDIEFSLVNALIKLSMINIIVDPKAFE